MAPDSRDKTQVLHDLTDKFNHAADLQSGNLENVRIENCIGFCKVPLGIAGPLRLAGTPVVDDIYAPLATYEATLIASCSRGCKAFNASGGIHIETLSNGMSRGPVFVFQDPGRAVIFAQALPGMQNAFA
ncbi:hypothetical protein BFJ71_g17833, partial [Fusarium oxysporum]